MAQGIIAAEEEAGEDEAERLEMIAPGIFREWLCEGRIISFRVETVERTSLDIYARANLDIIETWPQGQPFLMLQMIESNVTITQHLHTRMKEINTAIQHAGLQGRKAIAHPSRLHSDTLRTAWAGRATSRLTTNIFPSYDQALAWLMEML
jgi:hypothetical protein